MAEPNVSPLLSRKRYLAAKTETVPGTAEALTGTEVFLVFNPRLTPSVDMQERERSDVQGNWPAIPGLQSGTLTFELELCGSGNAEAPVPTWASTLLPACRMTDTDDTFSPDMTPVEAPAALTKTVTLGLWQGGKFVSIHGASGKVTIRFVSGKIIRLAFEFLGLYTAPTDAVDPTVSWPSPSPLQYRGATTTIGADAVRPATLELSINNDLQLLEDPAAAGGFIFTHVVSQAFGGKVDPEQRLAATVDRHAAWLTPTPAALSIVVGGTAGNIVTIAAPVLQFINLQDAERKGVNVDAIDFALLPDDGSDELTFTFT